MSRTKLRPCLQSTTVFVQGYLCPFQSNLCNYTVGITVSDMVQCLFYRLQTGCNQSSQRKENPNEHGQRDADRT